MFQFSSTIGLAALSGLMALLFVVNKGQPEELTSQPLLPLPAYGPDTNPRLRQSPHDPKEKHYVRTVEELAVIDGVIGAAWYWTNQDLNQRDWELRWDWPSWRRKLVTFDAVRFDSNDFTTNGVNHMFSGGVYYLTGRTNNLGMAESFVLGAAASTVWEYVIEYKELVSANDLIFTPF